MDLNQEKDLIARAKTEPEAFGLIFDEYYPQIFKYALKRTAHVPAAQDITSETFIKAYSNLWRFKWQNLSISSWLYRIATNEITNFYRKNKAVSLDALVGEGFDLANNINIHREIVEAEEKLQHQQEFLRIQKQLTKLDLKYQEVISLRFFENKKITEIAEILGKREGTIKSLLSRGLEYLRQDLSLKTQPETSPSVVLDESRENNY